MCSKNFHVGRFTSEVFQLSLLISMPDAACTATGYSVSRAVVDWVRPDESLTRAAADVFPWPMPLPVLQLHAIKIPNRWMFGFEAKLPSPLHTYPCACVLFSRFTPLTRVCRICKSKVNQEHHYCQECAFSKGTVRWHA